MNCTNCGRKIESESVWVRFPCPKCGKTEIIRCDSCRTLENPYKCEQCRFTGP